MMRQLCVVFAILVATPAWCQVTASPEEMPMLTPPPVSGEAYPTLVGSEMRSNYLRMGLVFSTAYNDNLLTGGSTSPVSDVSFMMHPTLALDESTPRQQWSLTYSPTFTLYDKTSALNAADQSAALSILYRLSPHISVSARDSFEKTSNIFNEPGSVSGGPITVSGQGELSGVIAPFADQISNKAEAGLSYQFSRNAMVGGSGTLTNLHFLNSADSAGLIDSSSRGGSAFYNRRLFENQYIGGTYRYSQILGYPASGQSDTQIHSFLAFYTIYFRRALSVSVMGGPQHYDSVESPLPNSQAWKPEGMASAGWQGSHINVAVSFSHSVTGGGGLQGAFESNSANVSVRRQIGRTWTAASGVNYAINRGVGEILSALMSGGHSISGTVSIQHSFGERLGVEIQYARLHQSYGGIAVVSSDPDSDRVLVSITYQLTRPLGR